MGTITGNWLIGEGSNIATLLIAVESRNNYQNFAEINYCPETIYNLLSLGLLARKGYRWIGKRDVLKIYKFNGKLVL